MVPPIITFKYMYTWTVTNTNGHCDYMVGFLLLCTRTGSSNPHTLGCRLGVPLQPQNSGGAPANEVGWVDFALVAATGETKSNQKQPEDNPTFDAAAKGISRPDTSIILSEIDPWINDRMGAGQHYLPPNIVKWL